ncbi:hypothetical protein JCM10908_005686 [Rhodotorula pacifica]|uniref:uncharacterized protein n=1 Tax=Rhodotorula pacifica TaxID=1495444 RepID=UPI00317275F2
MVALSPSALHGFLRGLARADLNFAPTPSATILPLLVAATLGQGHAWLKPCMDVGFEALPPKPALIPPQPVSLLEDRQQYPRRFLVAQVKEAIAKSAVLIGVPRSIELAVKLGEIVDEDDLGKPFVREMLEKEGIPTAQLGQDGLAGLRTVYKENLDEIFSNFKKLGLEDIRFLSQYITYGTFLTPYGTATDSPDPLAADPRLLSVVTLSTLVPQRTEREILWHLRGAIRRGWQRSEVEKLQRAIEKVAEACGVDDIGRGMPRVSDIELQPEEKDNA